MAETKKEVSRIASDARIHMAVESLRRWLVVAGLLLTAVFATWTDFRPYFAVSAPDQAETEQFIAKVTLPSSLKAPNDDSLISRSTDETKKAPEVVTVTGAEWDTWFSSVNKTLTTGEVPDSWLFRLSGDDARDVKRFMEKKTSFKPDIRRLVFAQDETPLSSLFVGRKPGGDEIFVVYDSGGDRQVMKVYYSQAPELSGLGSGIYGVPEAFSYPLRHLWYAPLLLMLIFYFILPVAKAGDNVCAYKRWQVVLSDFAGSLLYGGFMALPFFIVGGTVQALTTWIGFTAIFWVLAGLGLCAMWWSYFYAVYRIYVLDEHLVFVCPDGIRTIAFTDILSMEQVRVVPPKWLIILSFLAALSGKGSSGMGQAGRASLLAASSAEGLCIGTKSGDAVYIWITNSMGQTSLTHLDLLLNSLKLSSAKELPQVREFERIFPPNIERYSDRKASKLINQEQQSETLIEKASRSIREQADENDSLQKNASDKGKGTQEERDRSPKSDSPKESEIQNAAKNVKVQEHTEKPQPDAEESKETEQGYLNVISRRMENLAATLKNAHDSGRIDDAEFKSLHAKFHGTDGTGNAWTVGLKNNTWHRKEKGKWIPSTQHPNSIAVSADLLNKIDGLINHKTKETAEHSNR